MRNRRVVVVGQGLEAAEAVRASLEAQLKALGSTMTVDLLAGPAPASFAGCVKGNVLDSKCLGRNIRLARNDPPFNGSIVIVVTEAAIDLLPKPLREGVTIGPPAGTASYPDGWAVVSEFYRKRNAAEGKEEWRLPDGRTFSAHGRDHTVRHELGHLLGLDHHEALAAPAFPEAPRCEAHQGAHADCLMSCGSGDDDWFRVVKTGEGFGLCAKCAAAVRAFVAGLEEPF